MTDLSKATPRPWAEHGKGGCECGQVFSPDGNAVIAIVQGPTHLGLEGPDCVPSSEAQIANAALIVKAVNLHDELVAMLRECVDAFADELHDGRLTSGCDVCVTASKARTLLAEVDA